MHALTVIEHRPVDHTLGLLGKMLQVLVVCRDNAHHLMIIQLLQDGLCNGSSNLGLGATAHLIDENEGFLTSFG